MMPKLGSLQMLSDKDIIRMARQSGFDKWESYCLNGASDLDQTLAVGEYPIGEAVITLARMVEQIVREAASVK